MDGKSYVTRPRFILQSSQLQFARYSRVHGVDGLRVIDAAIMPFLVSSNTNAPAIAIGERGAAMILAESNARAAA